MKLHKLLDLRGNIPSIIVITHGKVHDVNILDQLVFEAGATYVMDRGYLDFNRLYKITRYDQREAGSEKTAAGATAMK